MAGISIKIKPIVNSRISVEKLVVKIYGIKFNTCNNNSNNKVSLEKILILKNIWGYIWVHYKSFIVLVGT